VCRRPRNAKNRKNTCEQTLAPEKVKRRVRRNVAVAEKGEKKSNPVTEMSKNATQGKRNDLRRILGEERKRKNNRDTTHQEQRAKGPMRSAVNTGVRKK